MVGIPPGKTYFFALGGQYNYSNYKGIYMSEDFAYRRGSWRFFTFHSLSLFKQTKITLSGFMMINGQMDFYKLRNFGALNMSLTQTFLKKRLSITLSARDLLHTMLTRFEMEQQGILINSDRYADNQRFGINIRYSFGVNNKEDKKGFGEPEGEY
jgi:iron complex outermembrane recepter protein